MTPKYDVLPLETFGRKLIEAGDLDPVYNVVHAAGMDRDQLRRWCLAYWMCYHAGLASWISEQPDFWGPMLQFAYNTSESPVGGRWPRGRERRHFRGDKAVAAVDWFMRAYYSEPERPVFLLESLKEPVTYQHVKNAVTVWPQFGPWIAFKVADMLERLFDVPVQFSKADMFYDSPSEAAKMWAEKSTISSYGRDGWNTVAVDHLQLNLSDLKAPPTNNRSLGLQEFETILCKWKAHVNGIYPVGIDTKELKHALEPWINVSPTAYNMHAWMMKEEMAHGV